MAPSLLPASNAQPVSFGPLYSAMACAPCQCCLWFLVLVFVSGPVSFVCFAVFYFVGPLAGCCACLEPFAEVLIEGVKYPQTVAKKMCG